MVTISTTSMARSENVVVARNARRTDKLRRLCRTGMIFMIQAGQIATRYTRTATRRSEKSEIGRMFYTLTE